MERFKLSIKTKEDVQKILTLANRCDGEVTAVSLDGHKRVSCSSTLAMFSMSGDAVIVEVYNQKDIDKFARYIDEVIE